MIPPSWNHLVRVAHILVWMVLFYWMYRPVITSGA